MTLEGPSGYPSRPGGTHLHKRPLSVISKSVDSSRLPQHDCAAVLAVPKAVIASEGYRLHVHRKLRVSRRHDRQLVTGLVVNRKPDLPRAVRRRLRAVADHLRKGRPATLTLQQLAGWHALQAMIAAQRASPGS